MRSPTSAACTSSAPAGTTPSGWTTSCAAVPAARATPVRRCSSPAGRTTWWCRTSSREVNKLPTETDEDGRIVNAKAAGLLDHAQRVAEGRLLDVHANTWRYNQLIAQQRAILVERRNTLLRTPTAREELEKLSPERYEELAEQLSEERLERICRQIMLYHLDRGWADHLAYLADIRESIHLRALGQQKPIDEFHRMAVDAFASLAADAIEAAQQTFETANVLAEEQGLDLSKLARPTSTWTYMVHDNPLAEDTMSALSLPGIIPLGLPMDRAPGLRVTAC